MVPNVVTFDPRADLIVVPAEVQGPLGSQRFDFALDTACAETLVTPEVVDQLGYNPRDGTALTAVTTALGRELGRRLRVTGFKEFGHTFADFRVNVHDLPEESGIDGLLGLNFLRAFNYEIRSKEGRIIVALA